MFGSRVLSLGDLLPSGPPATEVRPGRARRARKALARTEGPRRVGLALRETVFGDLDDKYLPSWQALRLALCAG